jgi:RNA polymerase sigma-70 factor (ECF subfamily)
VNFEELYERFRRPIWRLARRMTDSEDDALEATQEIFLRVWRGLAGFRGEAKVSTWIFQIAWNYLRGYRRSKGRQPSFIGTETGNGVEVVERLEDPGPHPERRATATDLLSRVEAALHQLPEHYRVVVWLRDGENMSYEEIAAALDVPIGTVRSRLARARKALKKVVEQ